MKTRSLAAVGILAVALASSGPALAVDFNAGAFGSYYDSDDAGEAWGGGGLVRLGLAQWFALDARASYLEFSDSDLRMIPLEAAATFRLPLMQNKLIPYAGGGVGYYIFDVKGANVSIDDDVGFFPLVGLELRFGSQSQWGLFGEARWLFLSSDLDTASDELTSPRQDDIDGLGVNVGISYRF
jgi:opacity protein-like surface antigen